MSEELHVDRAQAWHERLVGLLGRDFLEPARGLEIRPCSSVHTVGMRFPIDVVFYRRDGSISKIVENLRPWRAAWSPGAAGVVELAAGTVRRLGIGSTDRWCMDRRRFTVTEMTQHGAAG